MIDHKPNPDINVFAKTTFRGKQTAFGIKTDDRRRHVYALGKTGMGKSTMLENMIYNDIMTGKGVALVDPHGDLAEKMIDLIPDERINDVIYFNPDDLDYPIAFNILENVNPKYKHLVASGLVGVFKKMWEDSWGPRLEYILRNTVLALLDYPGSTLLGILRMLADKEYRRKVVDSIEDPVVKAFWVDEFAQYNDRFRSEAISPIQNKVGQFLSSAIIRNIVGQPKSTIDLRDVMDNKKILIINLAKGKVGEDNSNMLGSLLITRIQLAAMSRANVPEEEREDFYLYVDEFQNFATESFAAILSEARKYRLNLIVAHQYIEQMDEKVRDAIFGNVGTMIIYRVGAADAEFLEPEFTPNILQENIVNLEKYKVYMKLMIDGIASRPFSAITLPPLGETNDNREKVIKVTHERYANERLSVEEKIARWSGQDLREMAQENLAEGDTTTGRMQQKIDNREGSRPQAGTQANSRPENRELYNAVCSSCNKAFEVPFKPDGVRPVYCKDCLPEARRKDAKNEIVKSRNQPNPPTQVAQQAIAPVQPAQPSMPVQPVQQMQAMQPMIDPNTGQVVYPMYVMPQSAATPDQNQQPPTVQTLNRGTMNIITGPGSKVEEVKDQNAKSVITDALSEVSGKIIPKKNNKKKGVRKVKEKVEIGKGALSLGDALKKKPKSFSKKKPDQKTKKTVEKKELQEGKTITF
ncbi:CxxC-x17-CxxC domain-containing protein [Patescibacteria group bacterium]